MRYLSLLLIILLVLQIILGILNVKWLLPLTTALAHNAIAALILLTLISLWCEISTA
jgi:cytochrome c oxidase assembly protein subunit 15